MSFELASPWGNCGERELRSKRADSGAPQHTAKIDARISSSFLRESVNHRDTLDFALTVHQKFPRNLVFQQSKIAGLAAPSETSRPAH